MSRNLSADKRTGPKGPNNETETKFMIFTLWFILSLAVSAWVIYAAAMDSVKD